LSRARLLAACILDGIMSRKVAVFVGSLRKGAFTKKIADALPELAPKELAFERVEIGGLPFYNEDDEKTPPAPWVAFRDQVRAADAVLFITPEYNRSVPAALKNAIDVGSRPYGKSVWSGKPGAIISASPGAIGGFGANHHLRQSLVFLDVVPLQQPEVYLSQIHKAFDESDKLTSEPIKELLTKYLQTFAAFIETHSKK
jgi:chromate reductase